MERWTAKAPLTSYGSSGVRFVQFAKLGTLRVEASVETAVEIARVSCARPIDVDLSDAENAAAGERAAE